MSEKMIVLGIPTISRFDLLDRCIDSALAGTVKPDGVIVVDNSGGRCPVRSDAVYVVPGANMGCARSWNTICGLAGDCDLIISNDDVVFAPDTIEALLTAADEHSKAGIVSVLEGQRFCVFYLRHACYLQVGPFDEQFWPAYFEDNDYHYRLSLAGWDSPCAYTEIEHIGSATMRAASREAVLQHHELFRANEARYIAKWGGRPARERFTVPYGVI